MSGRACKMRIERDSLSADTECHDAVLEELARAAAQVESLREAEAVYSAIGHTPGLAESGIAPEVLDGLLPDKGVTILPKVKRVSGGSAYRIVKRIFDIAASALALIVLALPMLVVALRIRHESPGSAFYVQYRVGKNKKTSNSTSFAVCIKTLRWLEQDGLPRAIRVSLR